MHVAEASLSTDRAGRYLEQLCQHLDHLRQLPPMSHAGPMPPKINELVWHSDTMATVVFDLGTLHLHATATELTLRVEAENATDLKHLQTLIAQRVVTVSRRDNLAVSWQPIG